MFGEILEVEVVVVEAGVGYMQIFADLWFLLLHWSTVDIKPPWVQLPNLTHLSRRWSLHHKLRIFSINYIVVKVKTLFSPKVFFLSWLQHYMTSARLCWSSRSKNKTKQMCHKLSNFGFGKVGITPGVRCTHQHPQNAPLLDWGCYTLSQGCYALSRGQSIKGVFSEMHSF